MSAFITCELAELRSAERVIHGCRIFVIGQVIDSNAESEPAVVELKSALNMQVEVKVVWKT